MNIANATKSWHAAVYSLLHTNLNKFGVLMLRASRYLLSSYTHCVAILAMASSDTVEFDTVDFVESRLLPQLSTNRQQREFDSLSQLTLLPV